MIKGTPLAIVAGLLLLLTYLLIESRGPDQTRRARMQEALQALQLHDAELNRDVLLARAGLLPHYDSLPQTARHLATDLQELQDVGAALRDETAGSLDEALKALAAAIEQKLTRVEYLKSDNALLRNSIAYFTQSMRTLAERGESGQPAMGVAALSHVMLRFVQSPEPGVRTEAEAALARVASLGGDAPDLQPLGAHGRLILKLLPQLDTLLTDIVASPTVGRAEALQQAILAYAGRADARAQRFRLLLYLVALVLLGYVVFQVARLRARTRELRRKEMQLIQANKMTSLGMLVSGVAHEINNPNQIVLMNAGVLATTWDDVIGALDDHQQDGHAFSIGGQPYDEMREALRPVAHQIREGARRIERIIADLKDFARPAARAHERFQLNDVVQHALRLLTHLIRTRTGRFHVELSPNLPLLEGNPQQVEQVVVNLVINAVEALRDTRGSVVVTTSFDANAQRAALEVQDDGVGISREHLARMGEPFFTTKAGSGGTGLGLAIASSLVRLHDGRLTFASTPGAGTRAKVEFPCYAPDLPSAALPIRVGSSA